MAVHALDKLKSFRSVALIVVNRFPHNDTSSLSLKCCKKTIQGALPYEFRVLDTSDWVRSR